MYPEEPPEPSYSIRLTVIAIEVVTGKSNSPSRPIDWLYADSFQPTDLDIFNQREAIHMGDVKGLIQRVYVVAALSGAYILAIAELGLERLAGCPAQLCGLSFRGSG